MASVMYKSKVGWWIPVVVVFSVSACLLGPFLEGDYLSGIILSAGVLAIELFIFTGVKYKICGERLGIRNFYRWTWFPIDKISEIKSTKSFLSAPALSFDRLAIRFSDKSILKSAMPLEISPKDAEAFIAHLMAVNPGIKTSDKPSYQ